MYKLSLLLISLTTSFVFINKGFSAGRFASKMAAGSWYDVSIHAPVVKEAMGDYKEANPDIDQYELVKAELQIVAGINIRLHTTLNNVKFIHIMHRTLGSNEKFILIGVHQQNKL